MRVIRRKDPFRKILLLSKELSVDLHWKAALMKSFLIDAVRFMLDWPPPPPPHPPLAMVIGHARLCFLTAWWRLLFFQRASVIILVILADENLWWRFSDKGTMGGGVAPSPPASAVRRFSRRLMYIDVLFRPQHRLFWASRTWKQPVCVWIFSQRLCLPSRGHCGFSGGVWCLCVWSQPDYSVWTVLCCICLTLWRFCK